MQPLTRYTTTVRLVLGALLDGHDYGLVIANAAGLKPGTVQPILKRLEQHGWVSSEWETPMPEGRPPRRYYRLNADARQLASEKACALNVPDDHE